MHRIVSKAWGYALEECCLPVGLKPSHVFVMNLDTDNVFCSVMDSLAGRSYLERDESYKRDKKRPGCCPWIHMGFGNDPKESSASSSSSSRAPSSRAPAARGGEPFGTDYVPIVGCPLVGRASNPGTTGRFGMYGADFCRIGGHDEDCYGAGYQDIDLMVRANMCLTANMEQCPLIEWMRTRVDATATPATGQGCGTCRKNCQEPVAGHLTEPQLRAQANYDQDGAKILNCHPLSIQECKSWHTMNALNKTNMKNKVSAGKIVRNMGYDAPSWLLGEHELLLQYFRHDIGPCRPEQG